MANIEHLQAIHAPFTEVYEALTTERGLGEVWTRELIVHDEVGAINELQFGPDDLTKMQVLYLHLVWFCRDFIAIVIINQERDIAKRWDLT